MKILQLPAGSSLPQLLSDDDEIGDDGSLLTRYLMETVFTALRRTLDS